MTKKTIKPLVVILLLTAASLTGFAVWAATNWGWEHTDDYKSNITNHSATLLDDGRILTAGGLAIKNYGPTNNSYLYSPSKPQKWGNTANGLKVARFAHTATKLNNGRVLVAGGSAKGYETLNSSELLNPINNLWDYTRDSQGKQTMLNYARFDHTATLLPGINKVLVAGGRKSTGALTFAALNTSELYDPNTGVWTVTKGPNPTLDNGRYDHTAILLTTGPNAGKVLVAGGFDSDGAALPYCQLYNPKTDSWEFTAALSNARGGHTATQLADGRVLVTGGVDAVMQGTPMNTWEIYDPSTTDGKWIASIDVMTFTHVFHTATLLPDGPLQGQVLVAGGNGSVTNSELFNPKTNPPYGGWTVADKLTLPHFNHTATALGDKTGRVLLVAGSKDGQFGCICTCELWQQK